MRVTERDNPRLEYLREKTLKLTTSPGCYIMKNKAGTIIYIGKAKNLRNRVSTYFHDNDHLPKVAKMVSNVYDYEFIVTGSEYEALVLEASLIKQHKPKYNILLKDDKGYTYIKISDEEYPRITREMQKKGPGTFIGPYTSGLTSSQTVQEVNRVFMLPTCKRVFPRDFKKGRPCLNYQIKRCIGLCRGCISREDYAAIINDAIQYIKSGSSASVEEMTREMNRLSDNLEFEKAAILRDRIAAIKRAADTQKIFEKNLPDSDFIALAKNGELSCMTVLIYRGGKLTDKADFMLGDETMKKEWALGTKVGADILSIYDSGIDFGSGYTPYDDDEGTKATKTYLIKNGVLSGRLHSVSTAADLDESPTGNARAISCDYEPIVRMTNTVIDAGDKTKEELFAGIQHGYYIKTLKHGSGMSTFTIAPSLAYEIVDGKVGDPVKIAVITGNVFETLDLIDGLSDHAEMFSFVTGGCGKMEQYPLPVGFGGPYVSIAKMNVQ